MTDSILLEGLFEGLKIGESKTDSVTIAESSVLDDLKGNTYDASVSVVSIQVKRAPSVEDYVNTKEIEGGEDAFREDIRNNLFERKEEGAKKPVSHLYPTKTCRTESN